MQQTVGGEAAELDALYLSVSQFAQQFDPNSLSGADAQRILQSATRAKSVLGVIESLALVRIDETNAYKASGHRSAADYGAAKTGTTPGEAQRGMKTAKRARRLPNTDEAMRKGDLSQRQAEEIADAASVNPAAEQELLDSAKSDDLGTLRKKAKRAKFSADPDPAARARRIHARRSLRHWIDEEGVFNTLYRNTPEAGARFLARLKPHERAAFERARKEGRREAPEAYAADAFDDLISGDADVATERSTSKAPTSEPFDRNPRGSTPTRSEPAAPYDEPSLFDEHEHEHDPSAEADDDEAAEHRDDARPDESPTGRSSPPGSGQGSPPGRGQDSPGFKGKAKAPPAPVTALLLVELAALQRGHLEPGETCEIEGVGPIDLDTARAMLGDANVKLLIKQGDDIRTVVHAGRTVTARQRSALIARDPCCIVPGCGRTHNLEIDHRTGWVITETTSLDDLARLCRWHHHLKTHLGYRYAGGPGTWRWIGPDDEIAEAS